MEIREKVKALLRLADKAATEEEAANAFAKAQELIEQYKLGVVLLGEDEPETIDYGPVVREYVWETRRVNLWMSNLAQAVGDVNECKTTIRSGGGLRYVGHKHNVETARYMLHWIKDQVIRMAKLHASGRGRVYADNYKVGMVHGLKCRLKHTRASVQEAAYMSAQNSAGAMIKLDNALAEKRKRAMEVDKVISGIKFVKTKYSKAQHNAGAFAAGKRDSKHIQTNRTSKGQLKG